MSPALSTQHSVALVGRPNVGKSRLFNRLVGKRLAIVHGQPGVTRDVKTAEVEEGFMLMDTGGIGLADARVPADLIAAAEEQVFVAIAAAQLLLFVVDGQAGLTALDELIAEQLRSAGKPIIFLINKIDTAAHEDRADDFSQLGFGMPHMISAEQGRGIQGLRDSIVEVLGPKPKADTGSEGEARTKITFVGRPNVGKSSLCNRLLESKRLVVSEVPGTTRDSVELDLDFADEDGSKRGFRLVDTAGVRRRAKMSSSVEYFSSLRSQKAIEQSDVAFLVLDAFEGVTTQDKNLAGEIIEAGRSIAVVVNKWDYALEQFSSQPLSGYEDESDFRSRFELALRKELFFLPKSPILFVSALTGYCINTLLETAHLLRQRALRPLPTARLNSLIHSSMQQRSPRVIQGKRFKVYYAVQTKTHPHNIRLFCNREAKLEAPYRRYLERVFIKNFDLGGCPIRFSLVGKEKRFSVR